MSLECSGAGELIKVYYAGTEDNVPPASPSIGMKCKSVLSKELESELFISHSYFHGRSETFIFLPL